jgi:hypothetical protein
MFALRTARYVNVYWDRILRRLYHAHYPENFMVLRYESLTNQSTKISAVENMMNFFGWSHTTKRILCAFKLSEKPTIHRNKTLTTEFVYAKDPKLVCMMWRRMYLFSTNFSYSIYGNISCQIDARYDFSYEEDIWDTKTYTHPSWNTIL